MRARRASAIALALAAVGALTAAFAPLGVAESPSVSSQGTAATHTESVSLFEMNGAWVFVVVSVPVLVTLAAVLMRRRAAAVTTALLLWIGCFVGMFSVGLFFVPAAIAMTFAAARRDVPVVPVPSHPVA